MLNKTELQALPRTAIRQEQHKANTKLGIELDQVRVSHDAFREALDYSMLVDEIVDDRKTHKANYIGAPAIFLLETAARNINEAFGGFGCYLVGSALERPTFRDVDVRYIMKDEQFNDLFPDAGADGNWEHDPRWLLLTTAISAHMSKATGLPIDFQFQPMTHANARHTGDRHALGMRFRSPASDKKYDAVADDEE